MGREGDGIRKLVAVDHLVIGHRRAQHFDHVAVAAQRVAVVDIGDGAHHVTIRLRYASNARGDDEHDPGTRLASSRRQLTEQRSEEHTYELQSLMRISYAVFCLKKQKKSSNTTPTD